MSKRRSVRRALERSVGGSRETYLAATYVDSRSHPGDVSTWGDLPCECPYLAGLGFQGMMTARKRGETAADAGHVLMLAMDHVVDESYGEIEFVDGSGNDFRMLWWCKHGQRHDSQMALCRVT